MKEFYFEPILDDVVVRSKKNHPLVSPSHFHGLIEIAYCFTGKQMVTIGDTEYELNSGDALLIFPYTMHGYMPVPGSSDIPTVSTAILCNVNILSKYFPAVLSSMPQSPIIRSENVPKEVVHAFSKIFESSTIMEKIGWSYIILSKLLEQVTLSERKDIESYDLLVSIVTYINDNFLEQISIKSLAKKFAYSQAYIAHLFCDQLRIPFKAYLNRIRCNHAAILLVTTNKSITDIAHESGYNSINSFSRCFKSYFKKSPSQYRSEYMQDPQY